MLSSLAIAAILAISIFAAIAPAVTAQTTVTIYSEAALDGSVKASGGVYPSNQIFLGDDNGNNIARGFASFDISSIPAGATIHQATLRMHQSGRTNYPYTDFGSVVIVDHLDYGSTLDAGDFNLAALQPNIGTLSDNIIMEWKTLDVASSVQDDENNGRERSQYRLRFFPNETDNDDSADATRFESGDNYYGADNLPELVITYSEPTPTEVPGLTPLGLIALVGLLSVIAAMSIRRRKK